MNRKMIGVVAVSLFFIASAQVSPAQDCSPRQRLISVTGTAEVNVAPDEVILTLGIESHDKVLGVAKADNDTRAQKVIAAAKKAGIEPKYIETSGLSMEPDYSEEKVPRLLGYEVSQTITITLQDLSKYETVMSSLLDAGINRFNHINFQVAESRKYRDEARSKAIRAAKEKAVAMAGELGQTVGKPWDISEQSDWNSYGLTANSVGGAINGRAEDSETTVASGQITIKASVKVSFQLE